MNYCVNHPDAGVTAYCQNCGKGLCSACARTLQGNIYCEPCMVIRTATPPAGMPGPGPIPPGNFGPGAPPPPGPNTGTATLLGFIPGVGAMYNGQYIKAIVHVLVFVILMGMADRYWFFWLLLAFWVLYQVFDAHQTAHARRYGMPLPDPFGLNELGNRIGGHAPIPPVTPPPPPGTPPPGAAGVTGAPAANPYEWADQVSRQAQQWGQQAGEWGEQLRSHIVQESTQAAHARASAQWGGGPATAGFTSQPPPPTGWAAPPPPPGSWGVPGAVPGPVPPVPPIPPMPPIELQRARREPIGAIVLILLGMLFLLNTMGFFSFGWVGHGWPWIIVLLAVWLLFRNGRSRFGFASRVGPQPGVVPPVDDRKPVETKQPGGDQ